MKPSIKQRVVVVAKALQKLAETDSIKDVKLSLYYSRLKDLTRTIENLEACISRFIRNVSDDEGNVSDNAIDNAFDNALRLFKKELAAAEKSKAFYQKLINKVKV